MFHPSCCERIKKLVILDKFRVICCKTVNVSENNNKYEEETLKLENNLLKRLLAEMEDKNNSLKENNYLLLQTMIGMEQKVEEKTHSNNLNKNNVNKPQPEVPEHSKIILEMSASSNSRNKTYSTVLSGKTSTTNYSSSPN